MIILVLYSISMCTKLIYHVLNPLCVPQIICQWFILIFMLLDSICPYFVDFYILSNKGYWFFFRQGFIGPCYSRGEWEQTKFPLLAPSPRWEWECPGVWPEGWLSCFAYPLDSIVCRGHAQYPAFAPDPLILLHTPQNVSWVFWSLWVFCPEFAPTAHTQLFLVLYGLSVFCCLRCIQVQTLQQNPRSQPVSSPLRDSKSLLLIGKGVRISSSETSSCWTGAADPSPS